MRYWILIWILLFLMLSISGHAQESAEYTLFVGEFENQSDVVNPILGYLTDTLDFLLSRSKLVKIHRISPGLRSAYLQRARSEQPNADATQHALLAAGYGKADAVLVGNYTKTGEEWMMTAQLYVMREGNRTREDIRLADGSMYRLLDSVAAEVSKRLGAGQCMLLSTRSWEAYESYRQGHQAYYNFDTTGAIRHFQRAIELDSQLAIAHAELGMSYLILNDYDKATSALEEAMNNLQNASEQEQSIVMGLASFYETSLASGIPRMRDDMVWDEPWLHWSIAGASKDQSIKYREYKQWVIAALAYAKAGFYGASELADAGAVEEITTMTSKSDKRTGKCIGAFNATKDPSFLEAALQLVEQAADLVADDEYDDSWKYWQMAKIYGMMNRAIDEQQQRKKWLHAVKSKPLDDLSSDVINDIARKFLELGLFEEALDFALKAVELEPDPESRAVHLVTLADIYSTSDELGPAFDKYVEAFDLSARGDAGTHALTYSLLGLTQIITTSPEFVDETRRAKLNEIMRSLENMDPMLFRSETAEITMSGVVFSHTRDFCAAMGDMSPIITITRGMLKEVTEPLEQTVFLSHLLSFGDSFTESELEQLRQSLHENSGFESGTVAPWQLTGTWQRSGEASMEVVTELVGAAVPEVPAEGVFCLHVKVNEPGANYWDVSLWTRNAGLIFEAGKRYTLSAWLKAKEGTFDIRFNPRLATEPYTGYGSRTRTMTDTWAEYHVTTPTMSETVAPAQITINCGFSAGEFWIDGVRFYEGEFVPSVQRTE